MNTSLFAIAMVVLSSIIGAFGGFLFKKASSRLSFNIRSLLTNYALAGGVILYALGALTYLIALRHGELNILYPISSLTYIWSLIIARYALNEKINVYKVTGITLIIIGAFIIVS